MSLVLKEEGDPITIALRVAARDGLITAERFDELRSELYGLTEEVTSKFIGFFAAKSVKKGFEMTLDILSFDLVRETKRAHRPDIWAMRINDVGFKAMTSRVLELFKKLVAMPMDQLMIQDDSVLVELGLKSVKQQLLDCFINHRSKYDTPYDWYRQQYSNRKDNKLTIELVRWLVKKRTGRDIDDWAESLTAKGKNERPEPSLVINSMLLREALGLMPKPYLTYDEAMDAQKALVKGGKKWKERARARYDMFVATIPERFLDTDVLHDWFDRNFVRYKPKFMDDSNPNQSGFYIVFVPHKVQMKMVDRAEKELRAMRGGD